MLREYKAAGFDVYIPQNGASFAVYYGEDGEAKWQASTAKRVFDLCEQVGLKVILTDSWLLEITDISKTPDDKFNSNYSNINNTVKNRMANYATHPAFYGVMFRDEPTSTASAERFGIIYKAIKAAYPDCYVHANLLPNEDISYYAAFVEAMGLDYVMYDQYPMYEQHIYMKYISKLKEIASYCAQNGLDLQIVTQTYRSTHGNYPLRELDEADLYWLNNMLAGFGVDSVYYFTYYTQPSGSSATYDDGYGFIDNDGNKTANYTSMQKIMAEMQALAPVILDYEYNAAALYKGAEGSGSGTNSNGYSVVYHNHYTGFTSDVLQKIQSVSVDNERALVTELKNDKGEYMYMVQNVADPHCGCSASKNTQTTTLTFAEGISKITVYTNGVAKEVTLSGNTYTITQAAGQAVYIVL